MFAGSLDRQTIIADQPVLVVDGEAILNSFARVEEATDFIHRTKSNTAIILRHNGLKWHVLGDIVARCKSAEAAS
jgi:hypothetical protein